MKVFENSSDVIQTVLWSCDLIPVCGLEGQVEQATQCGEDKRVVALGWPTGGHHMLVPRAQETTDSG